MRKLFIALLAALLASGALAQEQPAFPDIPAGHWAADAVNRIADLGIVIGFPDGTFRGNEGFTRYQAALVVSRLLNVIADDIDAAAALTAEDLAALRNAVQELASDLAAFGVRLDTLEGDIGTFRDAAARLADLEAAVAALMGMDMGDMQDLLNRLESLEVAVDTALARAQAAEDAARRGVDPALAAQVEANARGLANLNNVVRLLTEDIDRLGADVRALQAGLPEGVDPGLLDQVDRNTRDIANLREFVILLRRDQVALRERVAALEEQVGRIDDLDARVAALEAAQITFTGSITLQLQQGTLGGDQIAFDVDRIFGVGQRRALAASAFTTGAAGGIPAQSRADIFQTPPAFTTDLNASFGFGEGRGGTGISGLDEFDSVIELGLRQAVGLEDAQGNTFTGYVFELRNIRATVDIAGVGPIQFQFGESPQARFTPYVFQTLGPGFVATFAPDFLDFLSPTFTVAYGIAQRTVDGVQVLGPQANYFGVRATLSPFAGLTLGVSLAQLDRADDGSATGVFGVDANVSLGFVSLAGEFALSEGAVTRDDGGTFGSPGATDLFYVTATVAGDDIPLLNSLTANYRSIPVAADFFGIEFGDPADKPFRFDQTGFGVNASVNLFILDLNVYFDSYSVADGRSVTAFGAETEVGLFAGFSARGFYRDFTVAGEEPEVARRNLGGFGDLARTQNYASELGAGLRHNGAAEDALIPGLNLNFEFALLGPAFGTSRITAEADYSLTVAGITLDPYVSFVSRAQNPIDGADTTIRAGTSLSTEPLDIFLNPSFNAAANFRTSDITPAAADGFTATEIQYSVGVTLNQFFFENSRFSARFGSYSGTNISTARGADFGANTPNAATRIHQGPVNLGGAVQTTTGFELTWDYFDLQFAYGMYSHTVAGGTETPEETTGNRFRVRYVINF